MHLVGFIISTSGSIVPFALQYTSTAYSLKNLLYYKKLDFVFIQQLPFSTFIKYNSLCYDKIMYVALVLTIYETRQGVFSGEYKSTGVLISPQSDQEGKKLGSMSGTRAISTTSRRELSSSPPPFPCKARRRRKFTPF